MIQFKDEMEFTADGVTLADDSGEIVNLGPVRARCVDHRITKRGVIRTWEDVRGGRIRFETTRLPEDLRKAESQ
jgi:hypothetical protein